MRTLLPALLLLVLPVAAVADDVAVELSPKALHGQGKPALILHANRPVANATLELQAEGRTLRVKSGTIAPGSRKELKLDAPVGRTAWKGTLSVLFTDGGEGEMPVSFETIVSKGVRIAVAEEDLDLEAGRLHFTLDAPAARCEYDVVTDGKPVRRGWVKYEGQPAGTRLALAWPKHGDDDVVLRIRLVCHDADGFFSPTLDLYPWKFEIPHEDVVFATGKSVIEKGEAPKLEKARTELERTLKRYRQALQLDSTQIGLYVVGHTDTVGDAASNRALSLARARAIASWFRSRGVKVPIHYTGMGEDAPAVPTPDETDEPANRRAQYLISVQPPLRAAWQKL